MEGRIDIGIIVAIVVVCAAVAAIMLVDTNSNNGFATDDMHVKTVDELVEGDFITYRVSWSDDTGEGTYNWMEKLNGINGNECLVDCYRNGGYEYMEIDSTSDFVAGYSATPERLAELLKEEGYGDLEFQKLKTVSYETYRGTVTCDIYASPVNYKDDTTTRVGEIEAYIGPMNIVYNITSMVKETTQEGSNTTARESIVIGSSLLVNDS